MANPVVTFEMENGDDESRTVSGSCTEHSEQLCITCKERLL